MAAMQAARIGRSVALAEPSPHLGGMSVEGLGSSDINNQWFKNDIAIGGLAADFYLRVGRKYGETAPRYKSESRVAEAVIDEWVREAGVRMYRGRRPAESTGAVVKEGGCVRMVRMENCDAFQARVFIDETIEGDLLAAARVSTIFGREPNSRCVEPENGIRGENTCRQFAVRVDPYRKPGDASSGLIPTIQDEPLSPPDCGRPGARAQPRRAEVVEEPPAVPRGVRTPPSSRT